MAEDTRDEDPRAIQRGRGSGGTSLATGLPSTMSSPDATRSSRARVILRSGATSWTPGSAGTATSYSPSPLAPSGAWLLRSTACAWWSRRARLATTAIPSSRATCSMPGSCAAVVPPTTSTPVFAGEGRSWPLHGRRLRERAGLRGHGHRRAAGARADDRVPVRQRTTTDCEADYPSSA